jgi:predicted GTPase
MGGGSAVRRSLVVGRTNVGKTLFCIQFAEYIGVKDLVWLVERTDGKTEQRRMSFAEAKKSLTDPSHHMTRCLQSVYLELPRGKGLRQFLLTDATGLSEGIHPDESVRRAMAQTLKAMLGSDVVLHVVDANAIGEYPDCMERADTSRSNPVWSELDEQLLTFGERHDGYIVLANKMDLPSAKQGYKALCRRLTRHRVVPISALYRSGFREVKNHVWRLA